MNLEWKKLTKTYLKQSGIWAAHGGWPDCKWSRATDPNCIETASWELEASFYCQKHKEQLEKEMRSF